MQSKFCFQRYLAPSIWSCGIALPFAACLFAVRFAWAAGPANPATPPPAIAPFTTENAALHQSAWAKHLGAQVVTTNPKGIRFILIPPGEFKMGCPPEQLDATLAWADRVRQSAPGTERRRISGEECPQHRVVLSKPYLLGQTEVTLGQFRAFVSATGYLTETEQWGGGNSAANPEPNREKAKFTWRTPGYPVTDESPVTQITRNDSIRFCNWLSESERLPPAYRRDAGEWSIEPHGQGYRLPTEAEWEFACRAGTTTHYSFGDDPQQLTHFAWYDKNADQLGAGRVASKRPNPFGLYDMHGNVWERCQDWFGDKWYAQSPAQDPLGPLTGSRHIARGGGWHYFDLHCRSAYRNNYSPQGRNANIGFRLARTL